MGTIALHRRLNRSSQVDILIFIGIFQLTVRKRSISWRHCAPGGPSAEVLMRRQVVVPTWHSVHLADHQKQSAAIVQQHFQHFTPRYLFALTSDFFVIFIVTAMECCCANDRSTKHAIAGLPPGWVDIDVSRLYISQVGMQVLSRSSPVTW